MAGKTIKLMLRSPFEEPLERLDAIGLAFFGMKLHAQHIVAPDRRNARAEGRPWRFVGMGISGGSDGALAGPSIMPGGDPEAWQRLRPHALRRHYNNSGGCPKVYPCITMP